MLYMVLFQDFYDSYQEIRYTRYVMAKVDVGSKFR